MCESSFSVSSRALADWTSSAFRAVGFPDVDAARAAHLLVQTSLWGIDSHGVARVPHYLDRITQGSILPEPEIKFLRTAAGTGQVDGGHGLGLLVTEFAMKNAILLAKEAGIGAVGIGNSSHCGAIGLYVRQAAMSGMIGVAFTHSDSFVVPHGGRKPFFGTNPIAIAIPSDDPERPLCLDMATSIVPWNRIMNARRDHESVPLGFGVDVDGNDSTNPDDIVAVKPASSHKGFALAFVIDMLCGPLNGMTFGPHLTKMYAQLDEHRKLGSFVLAIDISRFAGAATLAEVVSAAIAEVKTQGDDILYPGEPEYRSDEERSSKGIPVEPGLRDQIVDWSNRLHLQPPAGLS